MTRVNVVPASMLTDQHLLAELRELPRCITYIEQCVAKNKVPKVPEEYTLGTGHIKFFYDKARFLHARQKHLVTEWNLRGFFFNFSLAAWNERCFSLPLKCYNDYAVTPAARKENIGRLIERMQAKPAFYRYEGKPVTWQQLYKEDQ